MKKLSFALALTLICFSMFSCDNKSVVSPQNEDFKITTFSPVSGFTASEVTLFGENLTKDSIISIAFGDQTAEIILRSSDSLIVKVPRIAVGQYDITVKTKTKSYIYDTKYEVLENDFKITSFYPLSNFAKSQITLYGKNFDKYANLIIKIGDNIAEILSKSNDSITIIIPNIKSGSYDISVLVKSKSFIYDTKFEVLQQEIILDFTQYKNYSILIKGLQVKYQRHYWWQESNPAKHGSSYDTLIYTDFDRSHKNPFPITISEDGTNKYKCLELYREPYTYDTSITVQFEIDKNNSKFKTMFFKNCDYHATTQDGNPVDLRDELKLDLSDVSFTANADLTEINVKLNKAEILSKLSNFSFHHSSSYKYNNGSAYNEGSETFLELLGINDNATIEIKFTK